MHDHAIVDWSWCVEDTLSRCEMSVGACQRPSRRCQLVTVDGGGSVDELQISVAIELRFSAQLWARVQDGPHRPEHD